MDLCTNLVETVVYAFGVAAVCLGVKEGYGKWTNARRRAKEREAAHAKGEPYWPDVDWVAHAESAGSPLKKHQKKSVSLISRTLSN